MNLGSHGGRFRDGTGARDLFFAATLVCACIASARAEDALDEVVVSARKRTENARDVPISISEISAAELQTRGLVRVQDILRQMPNVSTDIISPRQASLAIRGIGRNPANDALESSVGVFLDGVYLGRPGMMVADLVDLDRVEVLRGPQGALFGKNATAGVVNIMTARPSAKAEGWLELSAGEFDLRDLRGAVSGPVGHSPFAYRLSGFATQRDGLVYDMQRGEMLGELRRMGARGQLEWRHGETTSLRLIADYGSQDEEGPGYLLVDPNRFRLNGSARTTNLVTRGARLGYTPTFDPDARRSDADARQRIVTENAGATLLADWDVGRFRLSSITGWRTFKFLPENDGDYSALDVLPKLGTNVRSRQISQELRVASPTDGTVQYLGGLHFFDQRVQSDVFAVYGAEASEYMVPGLSASALDGFTVLTNAHPDTRSYSAFGQVYWWPHESLEIAAGARWTTEDKDATVAQHTPGNDVAGATLDPATVQARQRLGTERAFGVSSSEDFVSGSISLTWHVNDDVNAYLSAARGAKSGGVNAAVLPAGADFTVDPEIALGFEAGVKTRWLDDRLQFNASVFDTQIDGYQASIRDRVVGASYLANAGEVSTRGAEAEVSYRPVPSLTLSAAAGYNDARYESFRNAACPPELDDQESCDFTGQRVTGAPPHTLSGSIDYDAAIRGVAWRWHASLEYSHSDGYRAELSRSTWIETRDLLNLRAGVRSATDHWSLTVSLLNALDETYYTGMAVAGPANTGVAIGLLAPPRTLGLTLRFRY
jgi:iron complex outermembrane receptor protein